jgi:hypothetical protein
MNISFHSKESAEVGMKSEQNNTSFIFPPNYIHVENSKETLAQMNEIKPFLLPLKIFHYQVGGDSFKFKANIDLNLLSQILTNIQSL